jgi:signal transduction histidine kinase
MPAEAFILAALPISVALILLDIFLWRHLASSHKPNSHLQEIFRLGREAIFVVRVERRGRFVVSELNEALSAMLPNVQQGREMVAPEADAAEGECDFLRELHAGLQRAAREAQPFEFEASLHHQRDNRLMTCTVRLQPMPELGRVSHVLCFILDISPHHLAEQLLSARAQEFKTLVEQSPDTIARYDRQCRRIYANPAFRRLALTVPQSAVARATEYCGETYRGKLQEALDSGQEDEFECSWQAGSGLLTSLIRLVPECDGAGKVTGVLSIGRDISTLKATESHLRESRTLLRELSARREVEMRLVRKAAAREMHEDYGQRLSVLRMHLSMLHMRYGQPLPELGDRIGESLRLLDETIAHMREIVSFIHPAVLNMSVAPALEWLARDSLSAAGIRYEVRVAEEALELDETSTSLVFHLVQNALSNVVRHARARKVCIVLEPHGAGLRLEVRDDGRGFDLDRARKGSLGMVAMEDLTHMLQGEIVFLSAPGKGAVIEVCFPGSATAIKEPSLPV